MRQQRSTTPTNVGRTLDGIVISRGLRVSRLYYFLVLLLLFLIPVLFLSPAKLVNTIFHREDRSRVTQESLISLPAQCSASVHKILQLPEEKIDVGIAALTFAKELYPYIDVASYSTKIDALAERVRRLAKGSKDPDYRVRCLNTVVLLLEKFQGTRDSSSARKSEKYYLNRVLDTRQGNCVSMPFLYVAVSQRLGWPVYLVHVPDHSFVRYLDPALREQNIEATSNGGYVSDEGYARDFKVSEMGRKSGAYLRTLSHRELLSDLAAINGITFGRQGDRAKAIAYLELATKLNPRNTAAWGNLITAYRTMANHSNGPEAERFSELVAEGKKKLAELGFVNPKDVPQLASTGRPI